MASLMEHIIEVLEQENTEYRTLIKLSEEKTPIIIKADLENLNRITEAEQVIVARIQKLEKDRMSTMADIAEVTNLKPDIKLGDLITMMDKHPEEQKKLQDLHDRLKETMRRMKQVNEQNRDLLQDSLEMVQFEMNLLQSLKTAPETADYNSSAYANGSIMGSGTKRFDAKQ
ncbi:MAG: flagellar protein FlgN [Lachnospiraceae bacterium]|nr:flagellar protein FlgN [Lachnospiraceae bacterium]MBO6297993.1 flagellar protein FlgN [Lachnospiraceae bacterium]MBP3295122.1 flagellar protein FlgN [Lachnospiraceae bacterium]